MTLRMLALALAPVCLLGQAAPPAALPAAQKEAEAAIRERAKRFYDLLIAGKARATEEFVCEASKDAYYDSPKTHPLSAEVLGAHLLPDGKMARVLTMLEDEFPLPMGTRKKVMKRSIPSDWKLDNGQWCYYLEPPAPKQAEAASLPPGAPPAPSSPGQPPPGVNVADLPKLSNAVTSSRHDFRLRDNADGKDEIVVTNGINGPVRLVFGCRQTPGLECKSDKQFLGFGGQARLTVAFKFSGARLPQNLKATLVVEPFHRLMLFPFLTHWNATEPHSGPPANAPVPPAPKASAPGVR